MRNPVGDAFTEPLPSNGYMHYNIIVPNLCFIFSTFVSIALFSVSLLSSFDFLPSNDYTVVEWGSYRSAIMDGTPIELTRNALLYIPMPWGWRDFTICQTFFHARFYYPPLLLLIRTPVRVIFSATNLWNEAARWCSHISCSDPITGCKRRIVGVFLTLRVARIKYEVGGSLFGQLIFTLSYTAAISSECFCKVTVKLVPMLNSLSTMSISYVGVRSLLFLTLALDGGQWSASRFCRFTPREITTGTHWIWGRLDHRTGLDAVEKRKILPLPGIKPGSSSL
jgi:hypothetical protein